MSQLPTWTPERKPLYDIGKSYEINASEGPFFSGPIPDRNWPPKTEWIDFLGISVASPIGVPAGPLLNSRWTTLAAQLGFDIVTYKTIRSQKHRGHPVPNIVYVDAPKSLEYTNDSALKQRQNMPRELGKLAITNSFGMPSPSPDFLEQDIAKANAALHDGQVLVVSIVGTPRQDGQFVADFVQTAKLAKSVGAHIVEANFSCPNVKTGTGSIYTDPEAVYDITKQLVNALGDTPLILKIGAFSDQRLLRRVMVAAAKAGARAIAGINTIAREVITAESQPALGENRKRSGICGSPIRQAALQFVRQARLINVQEKLGLTLVGVGGVTLPEHFDDLLHSGADIAMSGTGMMWDPYLAMRYHEKKAKDVPKPAPQQTNKITIETNVNQEKTRLILDLHRIGAIKFGKFTLKSGMVSPIYIDLRVTVSHPDVLNRIAKLLKETSAELNYDCICGIPYTAIPIATIFSQQNNVPMLMCRKQVKTYGTKKQVEGNYTPGQTCLIIDDLITSGLSKFEAIAPIKNIGLRVTDILVLVDREQGGKQNLAKDGYNLHAVLTISEILATLLSHAKINQQTHANVLSYLRTNQKNSMEKETIMNTAPHPFSYEARISSVQNPVGKRLLQIMEEKQTNLIISADVTDPVTLLRLIDAVGKYVCAIKTHMDILESFSHRVLEEITKRAKEGNFLLFEDRKFADIGKTVMHQYAGGMYQIARWADIVNAHALPGSGVIDGLKDGLKYANISDDRGILLLSEMSSKGNLLTPEYRDAVYAMAKQHSDFVFGFISQSRPRDDEKNMADPEFIHLTPGVKLHAGTDNLGQRYRTPDIVIGEDLMDAIIVGRGIYQTDAPAEAAKQYRDAAWAAYERRLT